MSFDVCLFFKINICTVIIVIFTFCWIRRAILRLPIIFFSIGTFLDDLIFDCSWSFFCWPGSEQWITNVETSSLRSSEFIWVMLSSSSHACSRLGCDFSLLNCNLVPTSLICPYHLSLSWGDAVEYILVWVIPLLLHLNDGPYLANLY